MSPCLRTATFAWIRTLISSLIAIVVIGCASNAATVIPMSTGAALDPPTAGSTSVVRSPAPTRAPTERPVVAEGESWIVFQSLADQFDRSADRDGHDHDDSIFLARPDGSGIHRLAPEDFKGSEIRPTWSPDGSRVAFIRARLVNDSGELWVINADGTGGEMVYRCLGPNVAGSDCNSIDYPDWTSDGSIYFSHSSGIRPEPGPPLNFEIWRYSLESGIAGPVLTRHERTVEQARMSPDASKAVYVSFRDITSSAPDAALFVIDLATGEERRITDWSLFPAYPDWSVGDVIVFNSYDLRLFPDVPVPSNLYTVLPNGQGLTALTDLDEQGIRAAQPRWTSDGRGLVHTLVTPDPNDPFGERHIWYMDANGANREILGGGLIGTHPELRP